MSVFLRSLARKISYVVAGLIVLAAALMCAGRLLAPVLEQHRDTFETWASELLERKVSIEHVNLSLYKYAPELSFSGVTIQDPKTHQPVLQIKNVSVYLSYWQTLRHLKVTPGGVIISGTSFSIKEDAKGNISVQGFPSLGGFKNEPFKIETEFVDFMGWMSSQPRLILRGIDVRYVRANGLQRDITVNNVSLENENNDHVIFGNAVLHQEVPTEVTTMVQWYGENGPDQKPDLSQIKGKAYFYVSALSLPQWFKNVTWKEWRIDKGMTSAKIWATWNHGGFSRVQMVMQGYNIQFSNVKTATTHRINRLSGSFGWRKQGETQVFAGEDIIFDLPHSLWPVSSFYLSLVPDATGAMQPKSASIGYLNLQDVQSYLFSLPNLPAKTRELLTELQLKGALQNTTVVFNDGWEDWKRLTLKTNFNDLSAKSWHTYPAFTNLSGNLEWKDARGLLTFNSKQSTITYDKWFNQPLSLNQLTGSIAAASSNASDWQFTASDVNAQTNDLNLHVNGNLRLPVKASPYIDLKANLSMTNAAHVTQYLPMRTFDKDLNEWLAVAIQSGQIPSADFVLQGNLNDYPYDQNNGHFEINARLHKVDLNYAEGWPALKQIDGKLTFVGRKMMVDIDHATIEAIPVNNVHGEIPYLGDAHPQVVNVDARGIQSDFANALQFIRHSPLDKTIGVMFAGAEMKGPLALDLHLSIPLAGNNNSRVQGKIAMTNAQMNMVPWGLALNDLTGEFQFTEDSTTANHIQGTLFNKPIDFSLQTIHKSKDKSVVRADFKTTANVVDLEQWLKLSSSPRISGETPVTGQADFGLDEGVALRLQSTLRGLTIVLPLNYGKQAQETKPFVMNMEIVDKQPLRLKVNYNKIISAALTLDRKADQYQLLGANIQVGGAEAAYPTEEGVTLTGTFDTLDWDKIKPELTGTSAAESNENAFASINWRAVHINAAHLLLYGQDFTQAELQVKAKEKKWSIKIDSPEAMGHIHIPIGAEAKDPVSLEFEKLILQPVNNPSEAMFAAKSLPALYFHARSVEYNKMPLGEILFKTAPASNGLTISVLRVLSQHLDLHSYGDWVQNGKRETTHLSGYATSSNISDLLASFGFNTHNLVAKDGRIDFKLNWHGTPYSPAFATLSGRATLALGKGRIVDVGEGNGATMDLGRMLNIFSLQTIPRRLSLDFSDMFEKGYSFDSLKGDISLQNGDVTTSDLTFEGPVARVAIDGRIGLSDKDYDFMLIVTPHVTSSIPVAAALMWNPLIGVAAFAVNTVITSQLSKVTTYYYEVTGPWDNPTWKSVSTQQKKTAEES